MIEEKISVTVGIPAYNEEANIGQLLKSILAQKQDNFLLKEIIVVSDGSNDNTNRVIKSIDSKKIQLVLNKNRSGKYSCLNQIISAFRSDYLVLIDADCSIPNDALSQGVAISKNKKCDLLSVNYIPKTNKLNFMSQVLNANRLFFNKVFHKWNNGNNIYTFEGKFLILGSKFVKQIVYPKIWGTDIYLFLKAKEEKYVTCSTNKISVQYTLPNNLSDHISQSNRFYSSSLLMRKIFGPDVDHYFKIPKTILLKEYFNIAAEFKVKNFIFLNMGLSLLFLLSFIRFINPQFNTQYSNAYIWQISKSTKY